MIDKDKVRDMLVMGHTTKEIAEELEGTDRRIQQIVKENGWKNFAKRGDAEVLRLLHKGCSTSEVMFKTGFVRSWIYKIKDKYDIVERVREHKNLNSEWTTKMFPKIKELSISFAKSSGFNSSDIESVLLDLMIQTDLKEGELNKDAYLLKFAPLKVSNLKLNRETESLLVDIEEDGESFEEERYSDSQDAENLLIMREDFGTEMMGY